MNLTVWLSIFSVMVFTATAAVMICNRRAFDFSANVFVPLFLSILLYDFIVVSNFLEHSGVTDYFDPAEDIAEIVFTLVFLFFVNNWRKERSEARFKALFKMAPLPMAEVEPDGKILEVNQILAQMMKEQFGVAVKDVPSVDVWWEIVYPDPDYRKWAIASWKNRVAQAKAADGRVPPQEKEFTTRDGTKRTMVIGGNFIGKNIVVSLVDITDLKKSEADREKLQEQLLQSQKLEAVGILAGGVAHDFNNMLGAIIGYAELTMDDMPLDHEWRKNLAQILYAAERSAGLTRQLLTFARKQEINPATFDVNESVESTIKMLRRLISENIELEWTPSDVPCSVRMDPSQFDQVLANLCVNARDAIGKNGTITVEARRVAIKENDCELYDNCEPGDYVLVSVTDDGRGMERETQEHIFEPFYTTKGVGEGTGLGLATVYGIVRQNNGMINVYSELGVGTTFNIYLPMHSEKDIAGSEKNAEKIPRGRGEIVLIVEDDQIVLEMSGATLHRLGYETLLASTPGEAMRIVQEDRQDIHLVITDVVMPEMDGKDLRDRLRAIIPGIKCIFMSGYSADIIQNENKGETKVNFIKKPFTLQDLAFKIREVLNGD